jgi:predicted RND superfamily exporter protein
VIPANFRATPQSLAAARTNILKSGILGRLVANDFTAAIVSADLIESDPVTGRAIDYFKVSRLLEERIRARFVSDNVDIHIIGFAKLIGDIADMALDVIGFFALAFIITAVLVYLFTRTLRVTLLPLLCSLVAVVWSLGLFRLFGFGMDPMSMLGPFLIFAIGVSHGIQMINAMNAGIADGNDGLTAARHAFRHLLAPGAIALLTDATGFLTILLIEVPIIQDLAIQASLGVMVILITNLLLLPILLSGLSFDQRYSQRLSAVAAKRERLWRALAQTTQPKAAIASMVGALALLVFGLSEAPNLRIGDLQAGVPELWPDSRYNRDTAMITRKFSIGADVMVVVVETAPDGCVAYDVMDTIDRFQWHMENVPAVRSTLSLSQVAKVINAGWNEGHPKWRVLPRDSRTLAQAVSPVETASGLLNNDCSAIPVLLFTNDHKAETIDSVIAAVKAFAAENDSERHLFRLAAGNLGIMAATNDVVRSAQVNVLAWIYVAIIAFCLLTFRSWRAVLCIVVPLSLVSLLCYALMSLFGIGLKISTLPVAALGVGIGVDYGIYILSRMQALLGKGMSLTDAYLETLRVNGQAVVMTALTLSVGVGTWVFSGLKFQADMGILLGFMFLANMAGAVLLLPALAYLLRQLPGRRHNGRL